jgi:hypothetical protein
MVAHTVVQPSFAQIVGSPRLIADPKLGNRVGHAGVDVEGTGARSERCRRRSPRQVQIRGDDDRIRVGTPVRTRTVERDVDVRRVAGHETDLGCVDVPHEELVRDGLALGRRRWSRQVRDDSVAVAARRTLMRHDRHAVQPYDDGREHEAPSADPRSDKAHSGLLPAVRGRQATMSRIEGVNHMAGDTAHR